MDSAAERFSTLDLSTMPFSINAAARERLDRAADAFDAARPASSMGPDSRRSHDSRRWQSWSPPTGPYRGTSMAFVTTVLLPTHSADWAEINLGADYETSTVLRVTCELHVWCWCDTDHNLHIVKDHRWLAGDDQALAAAFDKASALGIQWLEADLDPDQLREEAGLPTRTPSAG